mmetsp:Transcript_2051/g.5313  ORF Transcript_2051/g.5313 Transcript_2051/m.5313 type:complete len:319 (-) Transcript_2051:292-1248(-)
MKSVIIMPSSRIESASCPSTVGLIGTICGIRCSVSSRYWRNSLRMPQGHGLKPRDVRRRFRFAPPSGISSITCISTALNCELSRIWCRGPTSSSLTVTGSGRCSISCAGCRKKPTMGISSASEMIIATCVTVKPNTMKSGRSSSAHQKKHPSLPKKFCSVFEKMSAWIASERWPIRSAAVAIGDCVCNIVFPPLGRKCRLPSGRSCLDSLIRFFQESSVTIVTSQLKGSWARPRARATNGCTSPRVPLVRIMTRLRLLPSADTRLGRHWPLPIRCTSLGGASSSPTAMDSMWLLVRTMRKAGWRTPSESSSFSEYIAS